jgi:hypothetical protein
MIKKSRWKIPEIFCSSKTFLGNKSPNFMILFVVEVGKKSLNVSVSPKIDRNIYQIISSYLILQLLMKKV